jgi:hypothetical protein
VLRPGGQDRTGILFFQAMNQAFSAAIGQAVQADSIETRVEGACGFSA